MKQGWLDGETAGVYLAAALGAGLTLAQVNAVLQMVVLIGTAIFTWRKVLARRRDRARLEEEDSE